MPGGRTPWRAALAAAALSACAAPAPPSGDFTAPALAAQMQRRPIVLLGEVHDNAEQHAVRAQALALLLQAGSRPALAFEQFDRERQADIDRVLGATPAQGVDRAEQLAALGGRGWNWNLYRPFLELALQYRLPIVAANLSRADALRVSKEGFGAVFDAAQQGELRLNPLPADLLRTQQEAVDEGHCHQMPPQMLPALARAQIARDTAADEVPPGAFDAVFTMPAQPRADPCQSLLPSPPTPLPRPARERGAERFLLPRSGRRSG